MRTKVSSIIGFIVIAVFCVSEASAQYRYGSQNGSGSRGGSYNRRYQSPYQQPQSSYQQPTPRLGGGYQGSPTYNPSPRLSASYPPAPRVRRPVISPYLNLNRPEGLVGGVPNYYSLVRPRVDAFNRYQQGVDNFQRFRQENERRQQELFLQQQQDYQALVDRINEERLNREQPGRSPNLGPIRTQYRRPTIRPTGHPASHGTR